MTGTEESAVRYCDLVMKGGITSGLVYPTAVMEIGKSYRFRNIGGTSAGAIAAALSAAAALGERRKAARHTGGGGLGRLESTAKCLSSQGFIFSLFQPVPALRSPYQLLVKLSAKPSKPVVYALIIVGGIRLAPLRFALTFGLLTLLGYWLAGWPGVAAAALPAFACSVALAIQGAVTRTAGRLRDNLLGMCPGTKQRGYTVPALSDWMHAEIRALAGFGAEDGPPLTFGDLWAAPTYPDEEPVRAGERMLSLEVITTDVSHSEPRTLPFAKGALWFLEADMEALFPKAVVEAMIAAEPEKLTILGKTYHRFPVAERLPIVVAARMSLSFPVLICAVPLYEQHFLRNKPNPAMPDERSAPAEAAAGSTPLDKTTEALTSATAEEGKDDNRFEMRVCWFTDGGVSSNFPLHLFDGPMPRWPTFAIDLVYSPEGATPSKNPIFLPTANNQGWRPRYTTIKRDDGLQEIGAFLFGIVATMQNWRDLLQGRAPGHRDRVVQVEIAPSEGGMNLNMGKEALGALSKKGAKAGEALGDFNFENHFWVRYRNLQAAAERYGLGLHRALASPPVGAETAYARARKAGANHKPYPFTVDQAEEAARRLNALLVEMEHWADWDGSLAEGAPNPPPHLRIVPTF
jgi:predicted acylesterase/phospholipase RssA